MMDKDYYSILGITEEEKQLHGKEFEKVVSKKFRNLSLKYHPDKWVNASEKEKKEAEEKFKEISEANSILSDENQRNQYDMQQSGGWGSASSDFDMSSFFHGGNPFQNWGRSQQPVKGNDIKTNIQITLEEAFNGAKKTIKVRKSVKCSNCNGTGSSDGKTHKCPHCNGLGFTEKVTRSGNFVSSIRTGCSYCGGSGKTFSTPCSNCGGSGISYKYVDIDIDIPRGIKSGMNIKYEGKGDESPEGYANGDLIVGFTVLPSNNFAQSGDNLIYYDKVPFTQALLGYENTITCIDGTKLKYTVPELSPDNKSLIFTGRGMPIIDGWGKIIGYGDLAIVVKHEYPSKLTEKQKKALKNF